MKKFVIISIILLLIGGGVFAYSLKHYIDVKHPADSSSQEESEEKAETPEPKKADDTAKQDAAPEPKPLEQSDVFSQNYDRAKELVKDMSTEEMVGQLVIGVCSDLDAGSADMAHYGLAGYLFESDAFGYMSGDEIKQGLADLAANAKIKPILAAQEEGGEKTTVSQNGSFPDNYFDSPRNILAAGTLQDVEKTELQKADFLHDLGFNVNFAPVVDMPDSSDQIMYSRSLSDDVDTVSDFAKYCAKHVQAKDVSVVLKHFPGYGTTPDSAAYEAQANGTPVVDDRKADDIRKKDYEPFKAGAKDGVHFIMVSNVIVKNLDADHTAALSPTIHQELRSDVGFTGLIITDVIDDEDYSAYADGKHPAVAAILAGNDLVLSRSYTSSYTALLSAVNDGTISEDQLRQIVTRIMAYKYTVGLIK